jgi:hypothetical protein
MDFLKAHTSWFALYLGLALTTVAISIAPIPVMAADPQSMIGVWEGTLEPGAQPKRRIVVHISSAQDGNLSGTIDYPDQDISGTPITAITYKEPTLHFESSPSQTVYDGTVNRDNSETTGTFKQGGASLNLVLRRTP